MEASVARILTNLIDTDDEIHAAVECTRLLATHPQATWADVSRALAGFFMQQASDTLLAPESLLNVMQQVQNAFPEPQDGDSLNDEEEDDDDFIDDDDDEEPRKKRRN